MLCLLPAEVPGGLVRRIARYLEPAGVSTLFERRSRERRRAERRRASRQPAPNRVPPSQGEEFRLVRNPDGRRIAERRAELIEARGVELPCWATRKGPRGRFVERVARSVGEEADNEELRLIVRLQAGDQDAFDLIYERHQKRVYAYALSMLDDAAEAEDVSQDLFLKMLETVPKYEVTGIPFRIWLFRVLQTLVLKRLNKRSRVVLEPESAVAERIENGRRSLDDEMFDVLSRHAFTSTIEGLPEGQRKVLTMRFMLGLNTVEIAEQLGLKPNAVANLQYRALTTLRSELVLETDGTLSRKRVGAVRMPRPSPVLRGRLLSLPPGLQV